MADDDSKGISLGNVSKIALVSLLLIGLAVPVSLKILRPADEERRASDSRDISQVPARLWQDPMYAVDRAIGKTGSAERHLLWEKTHHTNNLRTVGEGIRGMDAQTMVIAVMVPGGAYPEDAEQRRRQRYAVLSALHARGYVAEDSESIRYVWTGRIPPCPASEKEECEAKGLSDEESRFTFHRSEYIPYEWFVRHRVERRFERFTVSNKELGKALDTKIMVLWLEDEEFRQWPFRKLQHIMRELHCAGGVFPCVQNAKVEAMLKEKLLDEFHGSSHAQGSRPGDSGDNERNALPKDRVADVSYAAQSECIRAYWQDDHNASLNCKSGVSLDQPALALIGPATSHTLDSMYRELTTRCPGGEQPLGCLQRHVLNDVNAQIANTKNLSTLGRHNDTQIDQAERLMDRAFLPIAIYSSSATTPWDEIEGGGKVPQEWVNKARFVKLTGDDEQLTSALTSELDARNAIPQQSFIQDPGGRPAILIVGEYDTIYAKRMSQRVHNAVKKKCGDKCDVLYANYLRGLDGVVPDASRKTDNEAREPEKPMDPGALYRLLRKNVTQPSEGRSQFDYVQRLAEAVGHRRAEELSYGESVPAKLSIRAVGVVGTDFYDKLAAITALKEEFPNAIFFTNDVDSRFLQREYNSIARNVVVASHYGLSLHPALQRGTPPFRDGYQTGTYLATLGALQLIGEILDPSAGSVAREMDAAEKTAAAWTQPSEPTEKSSSRVRMFEVGRSQLVDLDGNVASLESKCDIQKLWQCTQVHSYPVARTIDFQLGVSFIAFLLLSILLIVCTSSHVRCIVAQWLKYGTRKFAKRAAFFIVGIALLISLFALHVMQINHEIELGIGEPFSWSEGVSFWPIQLLRVLFVVGAAALVWLIASQLARMRSPSSVFATEFKLAFDANASAAPTPEGKPQSLKATMESLWHLLVIGPYSEPCIEGNGADVAEARVTAQRTLREAFSNGDVRALWNEYCRRTLWWFALPWSLVVATLIFLMGMSLMYWFGDPMISPFRSPILRHTNLWFFFFDSWAACFLTAITVYHTRLASGIVRMLRSKSSEWPLESRIAGWNKLTGQPLDVMTSSLREEDEGHVQTALREWLDFRFVVELTKTINPLIYGPFVLFAVATVIRSRLFDSNYWPTGVLLASLLSLAYALYNAIVLRREAEAARSTATRHLKEKLFADMPATAERRMTDATRAQIQEMLSRVMSARDGPFSPLLEQPFAKTLLWPAAGLLGSAVPELLSFLR